MKKTQATEIHKKIYFMSGLPRSGSTLLMNILGQNPLFHVTPTSGILDVLVQIRNTWDKNSAFRAMPREEGEAAKKRVIAGILQSYFGHVDKPICFDKNRLWPEYLEMARNILQDRNPVKVLVTVRDLRDVVASFEKLHRKSAALGHVPQEGKDPLKFKTAVGRCEIFIANDQPVGRAYNAIRDAVTRGWKENMLFIEYDNLTREPKKTMAAVYRFLGEEHFDHEFEKVDQITSEDDFVHGFKGLHTIRAKVEPQPVQWKTVFDRSVFDTKVWKDIEKVAQFWRAYLE